MGSPEEAGQPPRSPSAAEDRTVADQPANPAGAPMEPWDPGLTDADVDKIESEIQPEDLQTSADEQALRDIRRCQDQAWLDEVRAASFTGPMFELYWEELMRYGMAVMLSWTRTGKIIGECKKKNRPLERPEHGPGHWSYTDRLELAGETVAIALKYFLEKVLKPGKWHYEGGAALRTFFVGACLLQFPNVYNRWAREQHRWDEAHDGRATLEGVETQWVTGDLIWKDPTGNAVLRQDTVRRILADVKNPKARTAIKMVIIDGAKHEEVAEALGVTVRAVEGYIYRFKHDALAQQEEKKR